MDESQQDVLSADVVVVQHASLFLRQDHDATGSVCKPLKHIRCSSLSAQLRPAGSDRAPTSLTLVGCALSCLVDHSSRTSLSLALADTCGTATVRYELTTVRRRPDIPCCGYRYDEQRSAARRNRP